MNGVRDWFTSAADGFLEVVRHIERQHLDQPGLGEWDVRALLGHGTRAFLTIEAYLADSAAPDVDRSGAEVVDAVGYFEAARSALLDGSAIAERGRQAGRDLGEDPATSALAIGEQVLNRVSGAPDDVVLTTPFGALLLREYLRTRAFELTVHGLDLARAIGAPIPDALRRACPAALRLVGELSTPDQAVDLLLAGTGRLPLPAGFSVV